MGYDNNFMEFYRDGPNEGMVFSLRGPQKAFQQQYSKYPISIRVPVHHENSQQTERDDTMTDRESTTRDRYREQARGRFSRNIDVRYMKSIRERLHSVVSSKPFQSCNQRHCPMVKERLDHHRLGFHSSTKCSSYTKTEPQKCSSYILPTVSPSSSKYLSTRSGPEPKSEHIAQTDCFDCQTPETSSRYINTGNKDHNNTVMNDNYNIDYDDHRPKTNADVFTPHDSENYAIVLTTNNKSNILKIDSCNSIQSNDSNFDSKYYSINNKSTNNMNKAFDKWYSSKSTNIDGDTSKRSCDVDEFYSCKSDSSILPMNNEMKYASELTKNCKRDYFKNNMYSTYGSSVESSTISYSKNVHALNNSSIQFENSILAKSNGTRRNNRNNSFQREVREWIREIPMYPGLGKEAKEDNQKAINDLIKNLNTLSREASNTEYLQKAGNEINTCLDRLPIWYPGDRRNQSDFKSNLIDRLFQRIKSVDRKIVSKTNSGTSHSNRLICKNVMTEVNKACLSSDQIMDSYKPLNMKEIKNSIEEWLWLIYLKTNNTNEVEQKISNMADFIMSRLNTLLYKPVGIYSQKLVLESAIINIVNGLPININCPKNRTLHVKKLAEDLADRLLSVLSKCKNCDKKISISTAPNFYCCSKYCGIKTAENPTENAICNEIKKCLQDASIDCCNMVIEEATVILVYFFEMPNLERETNARNEIINLFVTCTNVSEAQANNIANVLIRKLKNIMDKNNVRINTNDCDKSRKPITLSVYTSIEEFNPLNYPLTSTPKKKPVKKMIPKLNPQEIQCMENIANLIRAWMDTLPESFSSPDERNFKETMINDLAGDIMDEIKLEQLMPGARDDRRKYFKYFVSRWIYRLGVFEITDVGPQIETFLDKLQEISVSNMTQPQHGNRQAMANIKHNVNADWKDNFTPKGTDVLEDEISIWMNEQPSDIFINNENEFRHIKIHELAQVLETKLTNKSPQTEISTDVEQWLNNIIKPERKREIDELTENLKHRVIVLPQDLTLASKRDKKLKEEAEYKKQKSEYIRAKANSLTNAVNESNNNETADQENTMKMFISKFIEHNYDIEDPLARRAFNRLLKTHLQRLSPPTREEVYDNFGKNEFDDRFPPRKLIRELEYIKDISDWLKNLPIDASFNTMGNRERIDFVNSLAINIREVEEERERNPDGMDYNLYMGVIVLEFLRLLPIPEIHLKNVDFMIKQLLTRITTHRQTVVDKLRESNNTTGVNSENIGDFIEEFIRFNGDEIAQDEVKLEVWAIRLIKEIKKIVRKTSRPSVLSKSHIYNKLTDVPIPGDKTAEFFSLELNYIKEITNWLKNLPLLPINESEEDERTIKICQLAEKMTELERNKDSSSNTEINKDFKEYVTKWISELPLNRKQEIVLPIVIQQLINRMEKVKRKKVIPELDFSTTQSHKTQDTSFHKTKKNKNLSTQFCGKGKCQKSTSNLIFDVIEKWVSKLPLQENENERTNIKNDITRKLFQEVGKLNMDPRVYNDDHLYKDMLVDAIETICGNLLQNPTLQNNKEEVKTDIINAIIEDKNHIKEKTAGDAYKLKLEKTIESSFPNPLSINQVFDPGFEMYKNRLATMFILENFDHGNDIVKMKYEMLLKKEIDKYFDHAKNKNSVFISKDRLYNELYKSLFKVPIPNEASIVEEVEKAKTRFEIDAWFEDLPMKESSGLNELLEWDQILSTLAKRIYEIEKLKTQPDSKIFKLIMKCLVKLPLQPENESKLEEFAAKLQERLKSTAGQRKCVSYNSKSIKGKQKIKAKGSTKKHKEDSQIALKEDNQIASSSSRGKMISNLSQIQQFPEPKRPRKKAADEICEIVQAWCSQLPIAAKTSSEQEVAQMLKDNLTTKIIIRIGEFNMNPDIFNNSVHYDELLDEELDKLLSTLPISNDLQDSKEARKYQLKEAIKSIKPLIFEERTNHKYKQELNNTINKVLEKPNTLASDKEAICDELRNDIIDNFVQYQYSKDDDKRRQSCKIKIQNDVSTFINNIGQKTGELDKNPLMKANQLISELATVPAKLNTNLRDEVEEIRMKKEVTDFLNELSLPSKIDKAKVNHLKASLANKLNEIEINGHTLENEEKMKKEIVRCLNKLQVKTNPASIDAFVNKLKNNEMVRRIQQNADKNYENDMNIHQEDCRRKCHSGKQDSGTSSAKQLADAISMDFAKSIALCSTTNPQNLQSKSTDAEKNAFGSCQQGCGENMEVVLKNSHSENKREDENSSDNEDKECSCHRKPRTCRRRPYCMVPIRYICEGYDGYNSFWCRMPSFF